MSLIDAIVWMWTISAAIGLPICVRSLHDALVDWRVQDEAAKAGGVPTRDAADNLNVVWQSVLSNLLGVTTQVAHLAVGLVALTVESPLRLATPLLLLIPQVAAVVFAVLDRRIRASLLRNYDNRHALGAASDRQPPRQPRRD